MKDADLEGETTKGESGWVDLSETQFKRKFFIQILGSADKPPLVFIPGTLNDLRKPSTLSALTGPFAAAGFRVVVVEMRNSGQTRPCTWEEDGAEEGFSHAAAYADDAAAVAAVVLGADTKYFVAGFSSGASLAIWLAARYPERVLGCANVAGGFYPDRMAEFAEGGMDDFERLTGDEWHWVRALLEDDKEKLALASNTQLKPGTPAVAQVVKAIEAENAAMQALEGFDEAANKRGAKHLQVAVRVCGFPPKEALQEVGARTFIAGGRFDGLHKLARMREMKKVMPAATLEMFPAAHFQVCMYAAEKVAAFFKTLA